MSEADLDQVCAIAKVDELPNGYDPTLDDDEVRLSGG